MNGSIEECTFLVSLLRRQWKTAEAKSLSLWMVPVSEPNNWNSWLPPENRVSDDSGVVFFFGGVLLKPFLLCEQSCVRTKLSWEVDAWGRLSFVRTTASYFLPHPPSWIGKKIGGSEEKVTSPFMGSWWCHVTTHRFLGLQVNQLLRLLIGWWAARGEGVFFLSFFLLLSLLLLN